ncbi:PspC domain-containing protein [Oceanobacillus rekensis]|uniref:PspC domain-containing protein n=1 Tax=Oceanobacillus rekensis TaxID=937927 RepID=UPI000B4441DA|nr:PspC domain-containing protein [Oceanobacillus rekensis]
MKRLYRSTSNKMLSGVLGGLGDYFHIDATLLRLAFALLLIPSFMTFALVYIVAAIIIPKEEEIY